MNILEGGPGREAHTVGPGTEATQAMPLQQAQPLVVLHSCSRGVQGLRRGQGRGPFWVGSGLGGQAAAERCGGWQQVQTTAANEGRLRFSGDEEARACLADTVACFEGGVL